MTTENFIEKEGYVMGGAYKITTTKLKAILDRHRLEILSDIRVLSKKTPNDTDLGREVRKTI